MSLISNRFADVYVVTADALRALIERRVNERYHPEFGAEWLPGGSLHRTLQNARRRAFEQGFRAGMDHARTASAF